jgi:hypothetical protein
MSLEMLFLMVRQLLFCLNVKKKSRNFKTMYAKLLIRILCNQAHIKNCYKAWFKENLLKDLMNLHKK